MRNYIKIVIFFTTILSCSSSNRKTHFTVINKSDYTIDSIIITNMQTKTLSTKKMSIGDSMNLEIDFTKIKQKIDGEYEIFVYTKKDTIYQNFGYYTNGSPGREKYWIQFLNDTILIKGIW